MENTGYKTPDDLDRERGFLTRDEELRKTPYYNKAISIIQGLWNSGVIQRAPGQCLSVSDMMYKLLTFEGVPCKIVECNLIVWSKNKPKLDVVGFENLLGCDPNMINTHVICVTNTEIPMLIDLSISNIDPNIPFICERLKSEDFQILSQYEFENSTWKYGHKQTSAIPELHQKTILERINYDNQIDKKFKVITKVIIGLSIITILNFIRGGADFYYKYINRNNGFGPGQHKVIKFIN
jgi:hypothetical protein